MERNIHALAGRLEKWKYQISDEQVDQLLRFYDMLIETNRQMNLTSITEFDEVMVKHFVDSAAPALLPNPKMPFLPTSGVRVLDLGTGAGFPGIPLKILFPELELTLVDSLNKRIKFILQSVEQLGLKNITAVHARAEELARKPEYREQFDICLSRAVANLPVLTEYCMPFVKPGGKFISYKGGDAGEELRCAARAIQLTGGKLSGSYEYELPDSDYRRTLIVIDKCKPTSKKYPRKAGTPAKDPL